MNINTIISDYLQAKQQEAEAKKRAAALKDLILQHAGDADNFTTDEFTVIIKKSVSVRLDTDALYKDFPDIKDTYGRESVSRSVTAVVTAPAAAGKSA